ISCGRCSENFRPSLNPSNSSINKQEKVLSRSLKIYTLDSGSCGACNSELHALGNPFYDFNRLGIFFVNTPKQADALFVIGVANDAMKEIIRNAYEVMAEPKLVFAMGACPASGNILGKSLSGTIDADVIIGGCPPDPFVILDAITRARGVKK
ncbi:MAG: NADH-quinone oxidoreductase subunit B family protein, partial [Thermoplasmataceae archaeon]